MKYVGNLIAIVAVVVGIMFVVKFTQSSAYYPVKYTIQNSSNKVKKFFDVKKHNISMEYKPTRKRRVTNIQQQEFLSMYMPDTFEKFSPQQWGKFWDVIYETIYVEVGGYKVRRHRTQEEVEEIYRERYNGVSRLERAHWRDFWDCAGVSWE